VGTRAAVGRVDGEATEFGGVGGEGHQLKMLFSASWHFFKQFPVTDPPTNYRARN
jgi:hypothetical protein